MTPPEDEINLPVGVGVSISAPTDEDESQLVDFTLVSHGHARPATSICSVVLGGKQAKSVVVTGGCEGLVNVWGGSSGKNLMSSFRIPDAPPVTSLCTLTTTSCFAVGTADGTVRIFHLSARGSIDDLESSGVRMTCLYKVKLTRKPITSMSFAESSKKLAVGVYEDASGFILSLDPAKEMSPIATFKSEGALAALLWLPSGQLLVGSSDGHLTCHDASTVQGQNASASSSTKIGEELIAEWSCVMKGVNNLCSLAMSPKIASGRYFYAVSTSQKGVETYKVPDGMFDTANPTIEPVDLAEAGAKGAVTLAVSPSGSLLASGGAGGSLVLYKINDGSCTTVSTLSSHVGPILSVCFSADSASIHTSGSDGALITSTLVNASSYDPIPSTDIYDFQAEEMRLVDVENIEEERPYVEILLEGKKAKQESESKHTKIEALEGIKSLSGRLRDILERNKEAPDLEKMDRDEFVIDVDGKAAYEEKNLRTAEDVRKSIKDEDRKKDMIASRIRQECWDVMENHANAINALATEDLHVKNLPVRKMPSSQLRKLNLLKTLRLSEIMTMRGDGEKSTNWSGLTDEVPATIKWIVNTGVLEGTADVEEIKKQIEEVSRKDGEEEKKEEAADEDEEEGLDVEITENSPIAAFLYHPLAIRTDAQRRMQITFLNELVRQISANFNKEFNKLKATKEDVLGILEGKNDRIKEILAELKSSDTYFKPTLGDDEIEDSVLQLKDEEITTSVYESKKDREARLKKEEEARLLAESAKGDDIPTRALNDMMNGTLEVKKEAISEDMLVREEWMDEVPFAEMTEDQKKALDEYNLKAKEIMEALEKQRKALELELKKIKSEVAEVVKSFDDKLVVLENLRAAVQITTQTQEMYCYRLGLAVMRGEDCVSAITDTEEKIAGLNTQRDIAAAHVATLTDIKDDEQQKFDLAQAELVQSEKNFRREIQETSSAPFDQETVKVLLGLYKTKKGNNERGESGTTSYSGNRNSGGMSGSRQSGGRRNSLGRKSMSRRKSIGSRSRRSFSSTDDGNSLGPLQTAMKEAQLMAAEGKWTSAKDPFLASDDARDKALKYAEVEQVSYAPLDIDDLPETAIKIADQTFDKLNELRMRRLEMENGLSKLNANLKESVKHMDRSRDQLASLDRSIDLLHARHEALLDESALDKKNIEVLAVFKQGQDEVEQGAVATNYGDAILIPQSIIKDTNVDIQNLGDEKVKVLEKTLNFRKKINYMNWEHEFLDLKAKNAEAHYVDLQLLRVNKQLKQIISGVKIESDRSKMEKAEQHLSKLHSTHADKMAKMEKELRKVRKAIAERVKENTSLTAQVKELSGNVGIREAIYKSRAEAQGGGMDPAAKKMKMVTMRRKLVDLARAQTDEVEFLRGELDRLRQKTFPSFANAARERFEGMPDEIMDGDFY